VERTQEADGSGSKLAPLERDAKDLAVFDGKGEHGSEQARGTMEEEIAGVELVQEMLPTPRSGPGFNDDGLTDTMHLFRVQHMHMFLRTYNMEKKYRHYTELRPLNVNLRPPALANPTSTSGGSGGSKPTKRDVKTAKALQDQLAHFQHELAHNPSPWTTMQRERFLKTAHKTLYKHFTQQALDTFYASLTASATSTARARKA
jgi:hypothetical protein